VYSPLDDFEFSRPSFLLLPWKPDAAVCRVLGSFAKNAVGVELSSSLSDCDFALLPFDGASLVDQPYGPKSSIGVTYARQFITGAKRESVPTLVVASGDA